MSSSWSRASRSTSALGGPYANYNWELLFHLPLDDRGAPEQEPALRRGAALVPLHLRPDLHRYRRAAAAAVLEVPRASAPQARPTLEHRRPARRCSSTPDDRAADPADSTAATSCRGYDAILRQSVPAARGGARTRPVAYQYYVVMKYLDNLIAWGDSLFRRTRSSRSTRRPSSTCSPPTCSARGRSGCPRTGRRARQSLRRSSTPGTDRPGRPMGNALVDLEGAVPVQLRAAAPTAGDRLEQRRRCSGIGRTLYFCVPPQRQAARLLGHRRRPAVQDPPLHEHRGRRAAARRCSTRRSIPGMLVKAAAAGIDLGSIVSGLEPADRPGALRCC